MREPESMPSHLGGAILGLLARRPRTGYDLARRMDRPVGYFWSARHSQIYPELARLEGAGLVSHEVIEGAGPRPTKRYAVTPAGMRALREWVAGDLEPQPVRDLETLKLWSLWTVEPDVARHLVLAARSRHAAALEDYARQLSELLADGAARERRSPDFASLLTLEGGVRGRQASVEWCDWMLEQLS